MATFAIISATPSDAFKAQVAAIYPDNHTFRDGVIFVTSASTAQQIARSLGVSPVDDEGKSSSQFGHLLVIQVTSNYWGFGVSTLWDWMKSSFEKVG